MRDVKTVKFYEIREDIEAELNKINNPDEEFNEETLETLGLEFKEKAGNLIGFIKNLEATIKASAEHRKNMESDEKTLQGRVDWAYWYLHEQMRRTGIEKVQSGVHGAKIVKTPDSYDGSVEDVDEKWVRTKIERKLDKMGIKRHVAKGNPVPDGVQVIKKTKVRISNT